jgi:hypothetical protein
MSNSIEALDLPLQFFALGTVIGMTGALIHHLQTGDEDHWSLYIAIPSTGLFFATVLHTFVRVVF